MNKPLAFILAFACSAGAQDVSEQQAKLEHIRAVNLERAAALPSFVADEVSVREMSPHTDPAQWKRLDTIESEISVHGKQFTRQNVRIDGKPWTKPQFPQFTWSVDFGVELEPLFAGKCNTQIVFDRQEEVGGRPGLAYRFQAPGAADCFGGFTYQSSFKKRTFNPPWSGRFVVEDPGGALVRFEEEAHEFPQNFPAEPFRETIQWDYVKIGDEKFLLPVTMELWGGWSNSGFYHVQTEFKNHRHFEASSNVKFH